MTDGKNISGSFNISEGGASGKGITPFGAAPLSSPARNNPAAKKTSRGKAPRVRDVSCRLINGAYIIEPLKRPKNRRPRVLFSLFLLFALLTGYVFHYGGNIAGAGGTVSAEKNFTDVKTPVSSAAPATPVPERAAKLSLKASSVEKDMSIRVLGEDGYPVVGHRFEVSVAFPGGENQNYVNDSRDGRFYIDELESGGYTVSMLPAEGFETPEPVGVEVLDKVQYVEIEDIEEKITPQSEIDPAADDPQYANAGTGNPDAGTPTPSEPPPPPPVVTADTLEFVESKVTESEANVRYTGRLDENGSGRLYARDGTLSNIIPVVVDEFLTGEYSLYEDPAETPSTEQQTGAAPETPSEQPPVTVPETSPEPLTGTPADQQPETPPQPLPEQQPVTPPEQTANGAGGIIDIFAVDQSGNYIYDITKHFDAVKTYYGWQDLDGKRFYFDKNGVKATGAHVIQGKSYSFGADGALAVETAVSAGKMLGIDVSTWQGDDIDWNRVKAAGIEFVMIRAGFRGYESGKIVEDNKFYKNLQGAKAAGLRVGVYFFSQAVSEVEGVEEASVVVSLLRTYGISLDYPVAFDSEWSGASGNAGRADSLSRAQRTAACVAFCETVASAGFTPMVYASKSWFEDNLSVGSFSGYKIWLAHYTPNGAASSYSGRYEMWQYTSKGSVDGISGYVDMNYGYMGY